MQSQTEGNFKTPTRTQLTFEGKSPTGNSTPNHSGSFMVLTGDDKPIPRPSVSGGKSSGCGGSNDDMSLIDDNPHMYDYGKLSPTLDALLAESSKIMHDVSVSNQVNISKSSSPLNVSSRCNTFDDPGSEVKELNDSGDNELVHVDTQDPPTEMVSDVNSKLSEGNGGSSTSLIDQISNACSSSATDALPADASSLGHQNQTLNELTSRMPSVMDKDSAKDALKVDGESKLELGIGSNHTLTPPSEKSQMDMITQRDCAYLGQVEDIMKEDPLNGARYTPDIGFKTNRSYGSPLEGSISSLSAKRRQILLDTAVLLSSELETVTPDKLNSSPPKQLDKKLSASPENSCLSEASKQRKQYDRLVSSGTRQHSADSRAVIANMRHFSPMAEEPIMGSSLKGNITRDTLLKQNNMQDTPTCIINDNDANNLEKSKWLSNSEFLRHDVQKESENTGDHETPLRSRTTLSSQFGSAQGNFLTRTDPARLKEKVPEKTSSYDSASSYTRKRTATPTRLEKRILEWLPQGPSTKESNILSENGSLHPSVRNDPGSPTYIQCSNGQAHSGRFQDLHILRKSLPVQDGELSGRKRRIEETILMDQDNIDEIGRIQKSPKVASEMEGSIFPSEQCVIKNNEAEKVGDYASPRHWTYIFSKFSGAMKERLLPLADNLNPKEVCVLEDMLGRLQKANKYKTLCNELQSQAIHDDVANLRQKRVAEARCLQQMLVYEQAKMQLLRLRHERLLKKVQLLQSGIQESQLLKLNSFSTLCIPGARSDQCCESHLPSVSVDHNSKSGEAYDKVTSKRQELGALDKKVKGLTKLLLSSCKIKGEPSSSDIVVLANDYLKKRTNCRNIRQDLQVSRLSSFIVFFFCHHIIKISHVTHSLLISMEFLQVWESFPNISAGTAFAFVFNAESNRNLGSPKNLAPETQLTSLLLSNLLDVVEEAHMAHIELRNLIKTSFNSPCVEQLDLQLHFIDFKTGCKVTLTLDMTSLNRGVYPSEILPSHLQTHISGTQSPVTQLLSAEILAAVGGLKAGRSRIIRLCRCVSQHLTVRDTCTNNLVDSISAIWQNA
ncbi:hypothetical protein BVC80_9059g60 [Macleaya cordata]|uniref:Uncharacterized protein n=1 Tax=Macleaya cordata TaxID=56857 RepID=A0A200RAJ6_MACCD|nr:hypothetical protein BVC80_9059g60 [Macleaya cordata]